MRFGLPRPRRAPLAPALRRARTAVALNLSETARDVPLDLPGARLLLASRDGVELRADAVRLPPDVAAVVGS